VQQLIQPAALQLEGDAARRLIERMGEREPARLEHGAVAQAVVPGQVVGGGEPVPAAADDDDVVARLRLGVAPGGRPVAMAAACGGEQVPGGVTRAHVRVRGASVPPPRARS
jgi:hypothetical protein